VKDVDYDKNQITASIREQITHGHYESSDMYGDGNAGTQIAGILATVRLKINKMLTY
jgi:UDP-N-acetylglucosamine 2-epimerase